jgi:hypothetical protein
MSNGLCPAFAGIIPSSVLLSIAASPVYPAAVAAGVPAGLLGGGDSVGEGQKLVLLAVYIAAIIVPHFRR